ncbi:MAG: Ig-like domain-containing protein, partial [Atopobiaceae bacterium]|nr:Ig-like domain-containing protein [Atopobiaceae bacterium]
RVQLDGNWYSVDTTWDSVNNSYRYLLKSDDWWISHPESRGFHSAWSPSDAPAGTDTTYDSDGFGDPYTGSTEHATVTGFELSDSAIGLDSEEEYQLAIVGVTPVGASTVDASWTSSDPDIVIVDSAGRLYATMEEGTAVITCTIDGLPRSCTVNVGTAGPDAPGVLVPKPTSRTVRNNGTEQAGYSADLLGERYTISGDTVGSSAGTYTSVFSLIDPGNTAWEDGTTDDFVLVWEILPAPVVSIGVDGKQTVLIGQTQTLSVRIAPAYADNTAVSWKSSDTAVATVDANGKVTAKKAGTATITATAEDGSGKSGSIEITVNSGSVSYRTHVQDVGWQAYVSDGAMSGTSGRSLRLEGINIRLSNTEGGIRYRTHIQDIGWQEWRANGAMSGTSGRSLRLEAIEIELTGKAADAYDIYYRVHAQDFGWMGWAKNGASAGTANYSYRLEGIQIVLVPKGGAAPSASYQGIKSNTTTCFSDRIAPGAINYTTHVQDVGWQPYVCDGAMSGTSGRSLRLEGILINLSGIDGGVRYRTHVQDIGWQGWRADNAMSGTSGQSMRLEAIQIKLTGKAAEDYDIYYRVHCENIGWMGWAKNGQSAGSAGFGYRLEGIQIVLVPKGGKAPGASCQGITQDASERFAQG